MILADFSSQCHVFSSTECNVLYLTKQPYISRVENLMWQPGSRYRRLRDENP